MLLRCRLAKESYTLTYFAGHLFNLRVILYHTPGMHKYITEFLGSFFLILVIGLTAGTGTIFAPLAIGAIYMAMIYMGYQSSGAHYNPAITLGALIDRRIKPAEAGIYLALQLFGGLLAVLMVDVLVQDQSFTFLITAGEAATIWQALLTEILFTFLIVLVYLHTTSASGTQSNAYYGLAISLSFVGAIWAGGEISGGAFNLVSGLSSNLLHQSYQDIWIYAVGPLVGGAMAGLLLRLQPTSAS